MNTLAAHDTAPTLTADTIYAVGVHLLDIERASDAVHVFRSQLLLAPKDERGWLGLAEAHRALGDDDTAANLLRLAATTLPATVRCLVALSRLERSRGDVGSARDAAFEAANRLANSDDGELEGLVATELEVLR